jgi:hypothetical protein
MPERIKRSDGASASVLSHDRLGEDQPHDLED